MRRRPESDLPAIDVLGHPITPRERRLYVALTLILGLNLVVISGAVTFLACALRK